MGGAAFQDEISPEELFNRFFGGGGFAGSPFGKTIITHYTLVHLVGIG